MSVVIKQGVVTLIGPVEPFVTVIKMKSIKGSTCQFVLNQAIKECFKEMIKQLIYSRVWLIFIRFLVVSRIPSD